MMDMDNIEDIPSEGEGDDWESKVLSYNLNDVIATKKLYQRSYKEIELRKQLSKLYKINCINWSNSRIGSELLLKLYCKATNREIRDVRALRTYRSSINLSEIIFPYITFKSTEFNSLLNWFKSQVIHSTKGELEREFTYKGFTFVYGAGGIHGSIINKRVVADDEYLLIDADVSSLYPMIGILNKLYPQHLGKEFTKVYKEDITDVRLREKALKDKGNKAIVAGFKEAANAATGKSNDPYSWLYDPRYFLTVTVNGQLMSSSLAEQLMEISQLIQINTDGLTVRIHKNKVDEYYEICKKWESLTGLSLEYSQYKQMIIYDVNNYIAEYTDGHTKCKGKCKFTDIPLNENKSHNIIPIAVFNYFIHNIPIEDTISNHRNIFDFCAGVRAKSSENSVRGKAHYELHYVENGEIMIDKLSKTVRYYISKKGKTLLKVYQNGTIEQVEAPEKFKSWRVTYFNRAFYPENFSDYGIDMAYYVNRAKNWISDIEDKTQLTLF